MSLSQRLMSVLGKVEATVSQPLWSKRQVFLIGTR